MYKLNITTCLSICIIILLVTMPYVIWRDIQMEKQSPGDLRNRIVGARLQMDGKLPYFFKWKSSVDDRYYDAHNFDSLKVSNITASPFLHQLLSPIANLQQRDISKIWLFIEYLLILLMAAAAYFFLSKNKFQKIVIIFTLIALLFSIGWISHIYNGQCYLIIPFAAILFYLLFLKNNTYRLNISVGILAAILLLIRPNLVFFLVPFIFLYKQYKIKNILLLFCTFSLLLGIYFLIPQNRRLWKEYSLALKEMAQVHQFLNPTRQVNAISPGYKNYEGWDYIQAAKEELNNPINPNQEHANVFVLVKSGFKYKMPLELLAVLPFILSLLFCAVFWYFNIRKKEKQIDITRLALFGYCLYMMSDFLSPVHRFPYNFMQWAFPLFIIAANFNFRYWKIYLPILLGLFLNIVEIKVLRSEHSVGEYLILFGIFIYAIFPRINNNTNLKILYEPSSV